MKHFILSIIKTERIPCRMFSAGTLMKILVGGPIKAAQTFCLIFHSMRMHNIHDNSNSIGMGCINKLLQLLGSSKPGRCRKETGNMVAKRPIIWMLLNGHNLNCIVSGLVNTRQDVFTEFRITTYSFLTGAHSYMALINQQRGLGWNKFLIFKHIRYRWVPNLCGKDF